MICRRPTSCRSRPSCAATSPARGWKEYQANGHGLRHPAAGRAARERPAARADLHAGDEGRGGRARREHRLRRDGRARRRRAGGARAGPSRCALYAYAAAVAERPGSCWPTRSSSSGIDRATTGRAAASSTRSLTPDSSRFWDAADLRARPAPGQLRQAVRARLARDPAVGQDRARARRCPTTSSRARAPATSRRSSGSPARASSATSRRTSSPDEHLPVRRQRHAQARHPRSRRAGRSRAASATSGSRASATCASAGASS